ncbi:MAG: HAD family hydrolase [Candidatus Woesearchaeota archaeon]
MICFDLDNTLANYGLAESETEVYMAEKVSNIVGVKKVDFLRAFFQIKKKYLHKDLNPAFFSRALWFKETFELLNIRGNVNFKELEKNYWEYLTPRVTLFPKTLEVLNLLKGKYKLACLTDSDGEKSIKIERLKRLKIENYFDYVITTDDTGKNKPAAENWEYLLKISGLKGKECMMVGDHPEVDLLNAKRKGFITVWSKEYIYSDIHLKYVDYEIKDIGELLNIIKKYG